MQKLQIKARLDAVDQVESPRVRCPNCRRALKETPCGHMPGYFEPSPVFEEANGC
jgi:hypothetical protein